MRDVATFSVVFSVVLHIKEVRRGQRTIYRGLQRLFQATLNHQDLTASLVPMSDGLLMIRKNSANITLEIEEI